MKQKILQGLADDIIKLLETIVEDGDEKLFEYFFNFALQYEMLCFFVFGVELE